MGSQGSSRGLQGRVAGPRDEAHGPRTARHALLIRTIGWASAVAALAAGYADQPALTLLAVAVTIGTIVASTGKPGHSRLAEAAQAMVLIVALFQAFGPPLAFLYT